MVQPIANRNEEKNTANNVFLTEKKKVILKLTAAFVCTFLVILTQQLFFEMFVTDFSPIASILALYIASLVFYLIRARQKQNNVETDTTLFFDMTLVFNILVAIQIVHFHTYFAEPYDLGKASMNLLTFYESGLIFLLINSIIRTAPINLRIIKQILLLGFINMVPVIFMYRILNAICLPT